MIACKRCAAILEQGEWRIIHDPTIGDIRSLRRKGAIILHQIREKHGNEIHKMWVTDEGLAAVHSTEYI